MKRFFMNRLLLGTFVLFLFSAPIFAFEWGGVIKNDSQVLLPEFQNFSLLQSDSLYLWFNAPFGKSGVYFAGEGMYKFSLTTDDELAISHLADLDLLKIGGDFNLKKGTFSFSAGRFLIIDSTSAIFSQNSDGVSVKYSADKVKFTVYAGYTGLLNALNVSMLDKNGSIFASDGNVYSLAHPYVPVIGTFEFPALGANQSLSIQGNAFLDFGEDKANRYYATLLLSGPISNKFFYSLATSVGSENFINLMNYSVLMMSVYPSNNLAISVGAEYASGKNAFFSPFKGITSRSVVNSVSAPETSSVIVPNLSTALIFDKLICSVSGKALLVIPDTKIDFNGFEVDLSVSYNVFSDLQLGLDVTSYFDIASKNDDNLTATLRAAISF